jgi:hypothetical protein
MVGTFEYILPVDQTEWKIDGAASAIFHWDYDATGSALLSLYEKGKQQQWNARERIDWSQDLDPDNPATLDDQAIAIYGSDIWNRMNQAERANLRRHVQAWQLSQFLHGEQGALICSAKLVQQAPNIDAKYFAATQTMDEARHVEVYSRLLREKFSFAYPITPPLRALLDDVVSDSRWDMTYLGMQVLIEGLALAAFQLFRDQAKNPLVSAVNAYVMEDEARHVAFGQIALRGYYPQLSDGERHEREEFVVEACYRLRDRFLSEELWEAVGLPKAACLAFADRSETMRGFRARLFGRIVPLIRELGLCGPKVRQAFAQMGVLSLVNVNLAPMLADDARVAKDFDRRNSGSRGD